jgi:hypothetical protein
MNLDEKIANALMTPYKAYKGMKKVPIELIWAIKQLIEDEIEEEVWQRTIGDE